MVGAGFALPTLKLDLAQAAEALTPAASESAAPPLDELFRPAGLIDAALSPDGSRLAALRVVRDKVANPRRSRGEAVMIDRPIDDGVVVIWSGLQQKHLQEFRKRFPHVDDYKPKAGPQFAKPD